MWEKEGRKDLEEKASLKCRKHPPDGSLGFLSLVLTKPYFCKQGVDSVGVRGLLRLMPGEYA